MILSGSSVRSIKSGNIALPPDEVFSYPEKILQFGTGVLLRGLPDYFVDKANRAGKFKGRIVIVKSTSGGDADAFKKQDGLYTICVRGVDEGKKAEENIISSAVSRVLSAKTEWKEILACASNPALRIVISNTTEVGLVLKKESVKQEPPESFPAKLLAFLLERYRVFGDRDDSGLVIIPTELIVDNGSKLRSILNDLAIFNSLDEAFIEWMNTANTFCSSLVDRIVPGKPSPAVADLIHEQFGYEDDLMLMAEVYRLWAIQGDEKVKEILSFAAIDKGVIIEPDIDIYRELKLRMLNGTHTLSCGLAAIAGFETVKDAMNDADMADFIASLMLDEIIAGIPYRVQPGVATTFGKKVLDRFRNPFIEHKWVSITMQYTSKMKMRNIPVLLKYYQDNPGVPGSIALGFAAYIRFMETTKKADGKYYTEINGKTIHVQDDQAAYISGLWQRNGAAGIVNAVLRDVDLWGSDLTALHGFEAAVAQYLKAIIENGGRKTLAAFQQDKQLA